MSGPQPQTQTGSDALLRLLTGRTRPMSSEQERQLVSSLAELLVDWIETHPGGLPEGLRSSLRSDLDGCSRPKEQP
jgi:bifunctional ADP-heptose synthase (sugar kinase/adenylyltransferase)